MAQGLRRCDSCEFWQAVEQTAELGYGGCRRYPPDVEWNWAGKTDVEQRRARWPSVRPDDWCGEWQKQIDA